MGDMQNNSVSVNMISEGTEIKGEVTTENDFRIAGIMDGHLEVKGKCIVTDTGKITGDLVANDADISGNIEGSVLTANKLVLRSTAQIQGDIYTKTILMEEGALFQGECRMGSDPMAARKNSTTSRAALNNHKNSQNGAPPAKAEAPSQNNAQNSQNSQKQSAEKSSEVKKKS